MARCFACESWGTTMICAIRRPGFKEKPTWRIPMCDEHSDRFYKIGLNPMAFMNGKTRAWLEANGWKNNGRGWKRPASEYELE